MNVLDRHNLIKPRYSWTDSGNGFLYSEIYQLLFGRNVIVEIAQLSLWNPKAGLLYRTPDNAYGQESHDNYTALACFLLRTGNKRLARQVLWAFIRRLGYMKNVPLNLGDADSWKETLKRLSAPWLTRFPVVWLAFIAAAFRSRPVNSICSTLIQCLIKTSSGSASDASGLQLLYLDTMILCLMTGSQSPLLSYLTELRTQGISISKTMAGYYDAGHPILDGFRHIEALNA